MIRIVSRESRRNRIGEIEGNDTNDIKGDASDCIYVSQL
jgi:hypothetical protein